jgi:aspartyl-tRNA synthetase
MRCAVAENLRNESVILATGTVKIRDEETYNPKIATGTVELKADGVELLSEAQTLPFPIEDANSVREDLRLRYRFLDLRRRAFTKT